MGNLGARPRPGNDDRCLWMAPKVGSSRAV
jgi:hypothetical protein